jgi:uncharacterized protein YndB with AHSA1/START domain
MVAEVIDSPFKTLHVVKEALIAAPMEVVFAMVLQPHGPLKDMNMKLEAWPGGRWFRDTGNNTGHLWGHVQVIKPSKVMALRFIMLNHWIQHRGQLGVYSRLMGAKLPSSYGSSGDEGPMG